MAGVPRSSGHKDSPDASSPLHARTEGDRAATAARLKGAQSKSPTSGTTTAKPEGMTPIQPSTQPKKTRPTKWQFGIRSRNSPAEAMLAIYKALSAMGAEWEDVKPRKPGGSNGSEASPESSSSENEDDPDAATAAHRRRAWNNTSSPSSSASREVSRGRSRERYGPWNDWGYSIPDDPWIIHARFRKDGMYPPGVVHASSTHSSRVDLQNLSDAEKERRAARRRSTAESSVTSQSGVVAPSQAQVPLGSSSAYAATSAAADPSSYAGPGSAAQSLYGGLSSGRVSVHSLGGSAASTSRHHHHQQPDQSVYVYVTIQLYCIEREFFLVDFKCAGYERIHRQLVREVRSSMEGLPGTVGSTVAHGSAEARGEREEWVELGEEEEVGADVEVREREELMGIGRLQDEKDVTSPFPFLDVAGRLIIQLAEAD